MNATLQGLTTIRGCRAEPVLKKEFFEHLDHSSSAWFLLTYVTGGFAMWLDIVCVVYIGIVVFSFLVLSIGKVKVSSNYYYNDLLYLNAEFASF